MKTENEIVDLISEVHKLLCDSGLRKESENYFLSYHSIVFVKDKNFMLQMEQLNMFWRIQLSKFGVESQQARYCLVDNAEPKQWIKLFKDAVLPFIISKSLPVKIC